MICPGGPEPAGSLAQELAKGVARDDGAARRPVFHEAVDGTISCIGHADPEVVVQEQSLRAVYLGRSDHPASVARLPALSMAALVAEGGQNSQPLPRRRAHRLLVQALAAVVRTRDSVVSIRARGTRPPGWGVFIRRFWRLSLRKCRRPTRATPQFLSWSKRLATSETPFNLMRARIQRPQVIHVQPDRKRSGPP